MTMLNMTKYISPLVLFTTLSQSHLHTCRKRIEEYGILLHEQKRPAMQVRGWSQEVLSWLQEVQPGQLADANGRGQCRRLTCFAAWVRVGALFEVEAVHVNNFIELAFQLCTSHDEGILQAVTARIGA